MKRIYLSTMFRLYEAGQPQGELGYVYLIDWETKQQIASPLEIRPLQPPDGKSHGSRGITIHNNKLYVATSGDDILTFSLDDYRHLGRVTHSGFRRLHQIKDRNGQLYVVSTGGDQLYILENNQVVEVRNLKELAPQIEQYVVQRTREDQWGNDMLHFNSVGWTPDGDEIHVYYNTRMVYNYTRRKIVYQGGVLHCPHDIAAVENGMFVNSSANKSCVFLRDDGDIYVINKNLERAPPECPNNIGFMHGLAIGDGMLFACSSPSVMRTFELTKPFHHIETFQVNDALNECIYDLVLDPRDWSINNV